MDYEGRPEAGEYASYYSPYIELVPAGGLIGILERQLQETRGLLSGLSEEAAEFAYAPGKWTVKEVVGHLIDAERIFSYRILRIGRGDETALSGFEENSYVAAAGFGRRSLSDLLAEFDLVRRGSLHLLRHLPEEGWARRAPVNDEDLSARAQVCITAGHELHHRSILEERYLRAVG